MPKKLRIFFIVKGVTLNAVKRVIIQDIYPLIYINDSKWQKKMPKNAEKYYCELCDYVTRDKQDYNRHLSTRKHKMVVNGSKWQ